MMRSVANTISVLFHPLFITVYTLALLLWLNPYIFNDPNSKPKIIFYVYSCVSLLIIPFISIIMMKKLNIITTFTMEDSTDRIGPMITVTIIYLWMFINYKNTTSLPLSFSAIMLGSTLAVMASFFINNFTKISLHAVGMGSLTAVLLMIKFVLEFNKVAISTGNNIDYNIDIFVFILISIVLSGIVLSSRLFLKAHDLSQIYLGLIVGFISQFIAFNLIF